MNKNKTKRKTKKTHHTKKHTLSTKNHTLLLVLRSCVGTLQIHFFIAKPFTMYFSIHLQSRLSLLFFIFFVSITSFDHFSQSLFAFIFQNFIFKHFLRSVFFDHLQRLAQVFNHLLSLSARSGAKIANTRDEKKSKTVVSIIVMTSSRARNAPRRVHLTTGQQFPEGGNLREFAKGKTSE